MEREILERLDLVNKRIDDNKTLITTIVSSATAIFAIIAIIFTWNVNTEKNELKELKRELQEEVNTFLGKNVTEPKLNLFTTDGRELSSSTLLTEVVMDDIENMPRIEIPIVMRNDGEAPSGEVTLKAYTKAEIELWSKTTFERDYVYETYWQGRAESGIPNMPGGGYAHPYRFTLWPRNAADIQPGMHRIKIQIYYGKSQVAESELNLDIRNNLLAEGASES